MKRSSNHHVVSSRLLLMLTMLYAGLPVRAQQSGLAPDERNTVEVFRRASKGVVQNSAQASMTSPFDKRTVDSPTGTGFSIDSDGRILLSASEDADAVLSNGWLLEGRREEETGNRRRQVCWRIRGTEGV